MRTQQSHNQTIQFSPPKKSGQLYWSHVKRETNTFLIESSALDGSDRRVLVNCTEPALALAVDFAEQRLYFVYERTISYVSLAATAGSTGVVVVLSLDAGALSSVTVFENRIYYSDIEADTIRFCDKSKCDDSAVLRNNSRELGEMVGFCLDSKRK